jgi:sterol desaturase/sphingolipid hydroxylase (fatty acid hydroxylase superfamily)
VTRIVELAVGLAVLSVAFGAMERRWPAIPGQRFRRAGFRADVAYWFLTPLASGALAAAAVAGVAVGLALASGVPLDGPAIRAYYDARTAASPFARWPWPGQLLFVLATADLAGYFMHRAFHRGPLWRVHAVHHSSTELDWLAAVRLHPLNDVGMRVVQALPFLLAGFDARVVAAAAPTLALYALFVHANVPWSFGPLRFVVASPRFHRWHHSSEAEGIGKNFAGLFPAWDVLFGTFHMPARQPVRFGVPDGSVPERLLGQLAHPFRGRWRDQTSIPRAPGSS